MSNFSISFIYPFRRVKINNFDQIVDPKLGTVILTEMEPDLRFTPLCSECGRIRIYCHFKFCQLYLPNNSQNKSLTIINSVSSQYNHIYYNKNIYLSTQVFYLIFSW